MADGQGMPQPILQSAPTKQLGDEFTKWTLKFEDLLDLIGHDLRGERFNGIDTLNGKEIWDKVGVPVLNENGINYIIGKLRSITNKNTYMSSLTERQAYRIAESTCHAIELTLFLQGKNFELDPQNFATIMDTIRNTAELALSRPIEGEERRTIWKAETINRIINEGGQQDQHRGIGIGPFRLFG